MTLTATTTVLRIPSRRIEIEIVKDTHDRADQKDEETPKKHEELEAVFSAAQRHLMIQNGVFAFIKLEPRRILSMKIYVGGFASTCAAGGGIAGGFLGAPAGGIGAVPGAIVGTVVGGVGGAFIGWIAFMIKSSCAFSNWKKRQTEETLYEFAKVFKDNDDFRPFLCGITFEIMQNPAIGPCGHVFEYEAYAKSLQSTMKPNGNGNCPDRTNYSLTYNDGSCQVKIEELRFDYLTMGKLVRVYERYISNKVLPNVKLTEKQVEGIKALKTDLDKKVKWCLEREEGEQNKLVIDGMISADEKVKRMMTIRSCLMEGEVATPRA